MSDLIIKTLPSNVKCKAFLLQISTQLFVDIRCIPLFIIESDSKRSKFVLDKISSKFIRDIFQQGGIILSPTERNAASLRYIGFNT